MLIASSKLISNLRGVGAKTLSKNMRSVHSTRKNQQFNNNAKADLTLSEHDLLSTVVEFIQKQNLCVLATADPKTSLPRASTVEFYPSSKTLDAKKKEDFILYVLTEGGLKIRNLKSSPYVSLAIHANFLGWKTIRGMTLTGIAEMATKTDDLNVWQEGVEAYKLRKGKDAVDVPGNLWVIKITPVKIEYLDLALRERGFAPRNTMEFA